MNNHLSQRELKLKMYRVLRWVILCWSMMFYSLAIGAFAPRHDLLKTVLPMAIIAGSVFIIDKCRNLICFDLVQVIQAMLFIYISRQFPPSGGELFLTTGMTVLFMENLVLKPKWSQFPIITIIYSGYILSTSTTLVNALLLIQTLTIWVILVIIAYRILYKRYSQVEELLRWNLRLSRANQKIAELTEEKVLRKNAQDLHDTLTQDIIGINMYLTMVKKLADQHKYAQMREMLTKTQQLTTAAVKRSRKMIQEYRTKTSASAKMSLKQAISQIADNLHSLYGLSTVVNIDHDLKVQQGELNDIQSVVHEALMNVIKHGHTKDAIVNIQTASQQVKVEIIDHGRPLVIPHFQRGHYGITDMKERAAKYNGQVTFQSLSSGGVKVSATFTVKEASK